MPATIGNLQVAQFFRTTTVGTVSPTAQAVTVEDVSGFPVLVPGNFFYLTLVSGDTAEVVRIGEIVGTTLHTFEGAQLTNGFSSGARAELWFTAEAFEDIQDFLETLSFTGETPPDGKTIYNDGGFRKVKPAGGIDEGINTEHIRDSAVTRVKIVTEAVNSDKLGLAGAEGALANGVQNKNLEWGIDADKIAAVTDTLDPAVVADLNMQNIDYTDGGVPVDGAPSLDGKIHFIFKA